MQQNQELKLLMEQEKSELQKEDPLYPSSPSLNPFNAYNKYVQILATSFHLQQQVMGITSHQSSLLHRLTQLESNLDKMHQKEEQDSDHHKVRRKRRLASQIQKNYVCSEERCFRQYGTLGSLQQHQRLKHGNIFNHSNSRQESGQRNPETRRHPTVKDEEL